MLLYRGVVLLTWQAPLGIPPGHSQPSLAAPAVKGHTSDNSRGSHGSTNNFLDESLVDVLCHHRYEWLPVKAATVVTAEATTAA